MQLISFLSPLQHWLDSIEIQNRQLARLVCHLIPDRCPFQRRIYLLPNLQFQTPALCKLNPLYQQLITLRLKSLTYLAGQKID